MSISIASFSIADAAPAAPRRSGRPSRDEAAALPARILASARELFLEQGFAATSVQQIAAKAGATKRTLYVKLGDKDALFRAVIDDLMQGWRQAVATAGTGGSLQERLEHIGLQLLSVVLAPDMVRLNRVLFSEAYRSPALVAMLVEQVEQGPVPQLARLLMEARGGAGTPTRDDEVSARLLYDMVSGAPLRVALTGRQPAIEMSLPDWVRQAVTVFLHGWRDTLGNPDRGVA